MASGTPAHDPLFSELPAFLPDLIDGEMLFSWAARYHRLSGGVLARESSHRLFGDAQAGLRHDFPANLGRFAQITAYILGSAEVLANKHTLLAYFSPFLDQERYRSVLAQMLSPRVSKLKATLGILPSRVGAIHPLKACRACMQEDMLTFGVTLWHLQHQFPAVWVCRQHGEPLEAFRSGELKSLRRFVLPEDVTEAEWHRPVLGSDCNNTQLRRIVEFSASLCAQPPCAFRAEVVRYAILEAAARRGLIATDGSLRFRALRNGFAEHYRGIDCALLGYGLLEGIDKEHGGLLGTVLRRYPGIRHPARQILVIAYFFDSSEEFLLAYSAAKTKLAEGEASVFGVPLSVGWREELRRQVEDEKKSVSEAARNLGIPLPQAIRYANQDRIQYDKRPRVLTPVLETQLRILIRQGVERSEITAQTGIKVSYLRAYLAKDLVLRDKWQSARSDSIKDQRRKDFMAFLEARRGVPVHLLRKTSGSGYAWLFRHDRAWLEGLPVFEGSGDFDPEASETECSNVQRKDR